MSIKAKETGKSPFAAYNNDLYVGVFIIYTLLSEYQQNTQNYITGIRNHLLTACKRERA